MDIQVGALDLLAVSILARDITAATITEASQEQKMAIFYASRMALVRNLLSGFFERISHSNKEEKESEIQKFSEADEKSVIKILFEKGAESLKKS